ncbi:histidinol-phosphatase HisJ [Sporolactobacillus shoreicorticis]|uniref:Histidinol-phosphatase n=1 Tax=Sporolactobacillus shoreicorticis TaxID=1923877 RepID=A0ABW5S381_9BACL|nr:histidinol-phosphatase HisJ [Sporolactobacillus shoreicorticis]MCO7125373.1 histidinol-phosphatase HisJ [Sporolactobacillus shoreicorticis]
MKWDGHTHSEFCPHGSGEDTELFIRSAIKQGMTDYSITEHAPLPPDFLARCAGAQRAIDTAGIAIHDVEPYLKKMNRLKQKYRSHLNIHVGFEIDYLSDYEDWTRAFLNEYGQYSDNSILSLHFLQGSGGYRAIDYSAEDYLQGIAAFYGSFQFAQEAYFEMMRHMVKADLGIYKPKRIGHMTLCRKFKNYFTKEDTGFSAETERLIDSFLNEVLIGEYMLDYNTSGMFKEWCGEPYPSDECMIKIVQKHIPLVFGSDAHFPKDVGGGYERFESWTVPNT